MIALDTNILVYSRREESIHHKAARKLITDLACGRDPWAIPWPCVYEFLRVVTHPRVFHPPTDLDTALEDLASLFDCPSLVLLGEGSQHPDYLFHTVGGGEATANQAHDAHIAALVLEHGVRELWTTDRDFSRFPGLRTRNPFTERDVHGPRARYRARAGGGRRRVARRR
jgi:toxin-antitoxin system PIN domain toxin